MHNLEHLALHNFTLQHGTSTGPFVRGDRPAIKVIAGVHLAVGRRVSDMGRASPEVVEGGISIEDLTAGAGDCDGQRCLLEDSEELLPLGIAFGRHGLSLAQLPFGEAESRLGLAKLHLQLTYGVGCFGRLPIRPLYFCSRLEFHFTSARIVS